MKDDRENDKLLHFTLPEETTAHYARRAEAAGRTLEEQLRYELEVSFGLTLPNPGDVEATQRGQLYRRIHARMPLLG